MGQVHSTNNHVSFCIADSGIGIYNSFKNSKYHPRNSVDAITLAIKEGVTRDPSIGQGNGLWGLHQILTNNKGGLVITSQNGSYFLKDARVKTFDKLPFLSKSMGGTIIDFQLDCKKEISISKSLGGHEPVNFRIESMESDSGDIIYKMSEQSSGTGTRKSGERIRNDIINIITETRKTIIMDFSGISVISSSFADELIGKLVVQYGFFGFNQIFRINNMNETVQAILHRSVSQRLGSSK